MDQATTGKGRSQFENDTGGFWWTVYLVHGIQKVRGSNPLGSTTVLSQDIVHACCKTLCIGQRPPSGW